MGRADVEFAECATEVGFQGPFIGGFNWCRLGWKESQSGAFLPFRRPHIAKRIARASRAPPISMSCTTNGTTLWWGIIYPRS